MARDPKNIVFDLLERYITFLPFDAKLEYLAQFIRTGQFERVHGSPEQERSFAFSRELERTMPRLTREEAEVVARKLLRRFVQIEIDSTLAREHTRTLHESRPGAFLEEPGTPNPFKLVISDHGEPLVASDLAEFLTLFADVYALAADLPEKRDPPSQERESYIIQLRALADRKDNESSAQELVIQRIRKTSPLTIWFEGIVTLIVLAAIISGGQVNAAGFTCKLNALGDGLKKLRAVFADRPELTKRAASKRTKGQGTGPPQLK